MRPHPKIRRTIKWTGLALSVVLVVAWVGSGWVSVQWEGRRGGYGRIHSGRVALGVFTVGGAAVFDPGLRLSLNNEEMRWRLSWNVLDPARNNGLRHDSIGVPLWLAAAPVFLTTAAAWRFDILARRRARVGLCAKCGYDLKGLAGRAGAVCPECGRATVNRSAP